MGGGGWCLPLSGCCCQPARWAGLEERPLTHQSHSSQKNKAFTEHGDKVVNSVLITTDVA